MGCSLTLGGEGGEKSAILSRERTLWTAQWLLDSVRGFAIPLSRSLSALPSSPSSAQFFPDSFIIASASTRVHAPRHDYWLS